MYVKWPKHYTDWNQRMWTGFKIIRNESYKIQVLHIPTIKFFEIYDELTHKIFNLSNSKKIYLHAHLFKWVHYFFLPKLLKIILSKKGQIRPIISFFSEFITAKPFKKQPKLIQYFNLVCQPLKYMVFPFTKLALFWKFENL